MAILTSHNDHKARKGTETCQNSEFSENSEFFVTTTIKPVRRVGGVLTAYAEITIGRKQ